MPLFSKQLKEFRLQEGYKQKDIADFLGLTPTAISDYEHGKREPSLEIIIKLAKRYRISLTWLLTGNGSMFNEVPAREESSLPKKIITLPVVADIAAGIGIEAYDIDPLEHVSLDPSLLPVPGPYLAFKVSGNSMLPTILPDDIVIVTTSWSEFNWNDHICALRTLDGLVLKRFYMPTNRKSALLIPLNPDYPVIKFTQDSPDYTMVGLLMLIIRKFI